MKYGFMRYDLVVNTERCGCYKHVLFEVPDLGGPWVSKRTGERVGIITGRAIKEYRCFGRGFRLDVEKSYVEVGAGLGELASLANKTTIIDPANYEVMESLLRVANKKIALPVVDEKLRELLRRCSLVLSGNVKLINSDLESALKASPGLIGGFDIIVDNFGFLNEKGDEIKLGMLKSLCKERGRLYVPK